MITWSRAGRFLICGACGQHIERGAPIVLIRVAGVRRPLVRGVCCAGPAPPDLPGAVVLADPPPPGAFVQPAARRLWSFVRGREPGEEG